MPGYGAIYYLPESNRADSYVPEQFYTGLGLMINTVPNTQKMGPDNRPLVSDDRIGSPLYDGFGPRRKSQSKNSVLIVVVLVILAWKLSV